MFKPPFLETPFAPLKPSSPPAGPGRGPAQMSRYTTKRRRVSDDEDDDEASLHSRVCTMKTIRMTLI